jgi:transposase
LSEFKAWNQKPHTKDWLLFAENIGSYLSLDKTAFFNGDLYTIVTNKEAKGKKGALVAMVKGTKADAVIEILHKIPLEQRNKVKEITLDMAGNMGLIVKKSFPNAVLVIDRFHVQKLALDAMQENTSQIIIYQTESGKTKLDVRFQDETVWLTQKLMAELFQTTPQNITIHLKNIFKEGELEEKATCKDFLQVQIEGKREVKRERQFYN